MTIRFTGRELSATLAPGALLLTAARKLGVDINTTCGGRGRCRGCRVKLTKGIPPPATPCDVLQLGAEEIREGFRLACQYRVEKDATVQIAPPAAESAFQIMTETGVDQHQPRPAPDSGVVKQYIPLVAEQQRESDLDALSQSMGIDRTPGISLKALRQFPALWRNTTDGITITRIGDRIVSLESGDTSEANYGMAFDIGTTTVVGYMLDLLSGETLATVSGLNPQTAYGGDLISRITFAAEDPRNVARLRTRIVAFINELIGRACAEAALQASHIYKIVVVGNTCMHHLFLGIDPTSMGFAPYTPIMRQDYSCQAREAGIRVNPEAGLFMPPLVAGFIGADTVAMALSTRIDSRRELCVAVDIGTNAEVVLSHGERLIACSSPAGPALEGGQIHDGMRAALGAIDKVRMDEDVILGTIGDVPPIGICGSGLIDATAALLDAGIVTPSGRLLTEPPESVPGALRSRININHAGVPQFVLAWAHDSGNHKDIVLSQLDIRQLQLAKGAISSATTALAQVAGVVQEDIAEFILAGGFGNYLNLQSACRIGLLPDLPSRVRYVANAAGLGAQLALVSEREYDHAVELARRIEHVSLAEHPGFQRIYLDSLSFPADTDSMPAS